MKRVMKQYGVTAVAVLVMALSHGCSMIDLNGDGEVNAKAFVADLDFGIELIGPTGEVYSVQTTPEGQVDVQATFVDSSGNVFVLGEGVGNVKVTNKATGATGYIRPKVKK